MASNPLPQARRPRRGAVPTGLEPTTDEVPSVPASGACLLRDALRTVRRFSSTGVFHSLSTTAPDCAGPPPLHVRMDRPPHCGRPRGVPARLVSACLHVRERGGTGQLEPGSAWAVGENGRSRYIFGPFMGISLRSGRDGRPRPQRTGPGGNALRGPARSTHGRVGAAQYQRRLPPHRSAGAGFPSHTRLSSP